MKRYPQAIEYADRAATLWREINGPGSGSEAAAISIGGHARKESGDYAGAEAKYREALALRRARPEPKARDVVSSLDDLGGTLVLAGRVDEGLGVLEEAMTLATKTGAKVPADQIASVEIELAKGLIKARRDRPRALALARAAHDRLVGADEAAERAEVAKWLAEQGAPVP
jgi:tetratricopeptide (TPR) repeat protein